MDEDYVVIWTCLARGEDMWTSHILRRGTTMKDFKKKIAGFYFHTEDGLSVATYHEVLKDAACTCPLSTFTSRDMPSSLLGLV